MSALRCQDIQQRMLEKKAVELAESEREHLRVCAACRAFAQDVLEAGISLGEIAEQVNQASIDELPRELSQRVKIDILEKLEGEAKGEKREVVRLVMPTEEAGTPWWEPIANVVARWRWAMAAALALIALGAGIAQVVAARNIGRLEFAREHTELRAGSAQTYEGVGSWGCQRGATLTTGANGGAFFSLGKDVRVAMAGGTSLKILDRERLSLDTGTVWLNVEPGGKGFIIDTPFGQVKVTGTLFGVSLSGQGARVEVTRGSVVVSQGKGQGTITAGQYLTSSPAGVTPPTARQDGINYPGWVLELSQQEKVAHSRHYLPSIGKRK